MSSPSIFQTFAPPFFSTLLIHPPLSSRISNRAPTQSQTEERLLTNMKKIFAVLAFVVFGFANTSNVSAQKMEDPMVGGAPMYPTKDIVDNAVNSKDHTTLVAAVKAAGLVDTLKSAGPFTVFAPTN